MVLSVSSILVQIHRSEDVPKPPVLNRSRPTPKRDWLPTNYEPDPVA